MLVTRILFIMENNRVSISYLDAISNKIEQIHINNNSLSFYHTHGSSRSSSPYSSFQDNSLWGELEFCLVLELERELNFNIYSEHLPIIDSA